MATPNYAYEKRQRELAKKRKKEEKLKRKSDPRPGDEAGAPSDASDQEGAPPPASDTPAGS